MFLGDPKQQALTNPQSLNSYSYANDNPITKSDPTGLGNSSGQKVFSDNRTNGVFSEANDVAMLNANVRSVSGGIPASNFESWLNAVKPGGSWDYKDPAARGGRQFYFFNGQLIDANAFGNANYGYTGAAIGIGSDTLVDAAGAVAAYDSGKTNRATANQHVVRGADTGWPTRTEHVRALAMSRAQI